MQGRMEEVINFASQQFIPGHKSISSDELTTLLKIYKLDTIFNKDTLPISYFKFLQLSHNEHHYPATNITSRIILAQGPTTPTAEDFFNTLDLFSQNKAIQTIFALTNCLSSPSHHYGDCINYFLPVGEQPSCHHGKYQIEIENAEKINKNNTHPHRVNPQIQPPYYKIINSGQVIITPGTSLKSKLKITDTKNNKSANVRLFSYGTNSDTLPALSDAHKMSIIMNFYQFSLMQRTLFHSAIGCGRASTMIFTFLTFELLLHADRIAPCATTQKQAELIILLLTELRKNVPGFLHNLDAFKNAISTAFQMHAEVMKQKILSSRVFYRYPSHISELPVFKPFFSEKSQLRPISGMEPQRLHARKVSNNSPIHRDKAPTPLKLPSLTQSR